MNNTRFATCIHILTLLAKNKGEYLNSELIAESIGIHPVVVRRELGVLHREGWIETKKGKEGGAKLQVSACEISLADLFTALQNTNVLGKKNNCPDTPCPIGKSINKALQQLFDETDQAFLSVLSQKKLKDFVDQF